MKTMRMTAIGAVAMVLTVGMTMAEERAAAPVPAASTAAKVCPLAGKPQVTCPVMGGKAATNIYVDVECCRIYVCCQSCVDQVKADPKKYLAVIAKNGEAPECRCCMKCGEINGDAKCCKDAPKCEKCGFHKASPGCKAVDAAKTGGACCGAKAGAVAGDKPAAACPMKAEKTE